MSNVISSGCRSIRILIWFLLFDSWRQKSVNVYHYTTWDAVASKNSFLPWKLLFFAALEQLSSSKNSFEILWFNSSFSVLQDIIDPLAPLAENAPSWPCAAKEAGTSKNFDNDVKFLQEKIIGMRWEYNEVKYNISIICRYTWFNIENDRSELWQIWLRGVLITWRLPQTISMIKQIINWQLLSVLTTCRSDSTENNIRGNGFSQSSSFWFIFRCDVNFIKIFLLLIWEHLSWGERWQCHWFQYIVTTQRPGFIFTDDGCQKLTIFNLKLDFVAEVNSQQHFYYQQDNIQNVKISKILIWDTIIPVIRWMFHINFLMVGELSWFNLQRGTTLIGSLVVLADLGVGQLIPFSIALIDTV